MLLRSLSRVHHISGLQQESWLELTVAKMSVWRQLTLLDIQHNQLLSAQLHIRVVMSCRRAGWS